MGAISSKRGRPRIFIDEKFRLCHNGIMKTFLSLIVSLVLLCPLYAGGHGGHGGRGGRGGLGGHDGGRGGHDGRNGHNHFDFNHDRHDHGRFNGFEGGFYGQVIILDDGCYFWDGQMWEITDCN